MIENLRKYTVLIVILFVLVIIGFFLMDANTMQKSQGGMPILKIANRTYTDSDVRKVGASGFELAQSLAYPGGYNIDFEVFKFTNALKGNPSSDYEAAENFFINRILLRSAKTEFGIYPSDEEIDKNIRQFRAFTSQDGAFSEEIYRNFIDRGLGRLGLLESDVRELTSDIIIYRKLSEILSTGLTSDRDVVSKQTAIDGQRINSKLAQIDATAIKASIAPTEEEIKTYWETVRDAFKTDEKRKLTYFIVKSTPDADPAPVAPLADGADDAAKADHAKKTAERDATIVENKRVARVKVGKDVDDFLYALETQKNADFKKLAQEKNFELKHTELIAMSEAPAELLAPLQSSSRAGSAADALFNLTVTSDPFSKITDLSIGETEWLVAYIDEVLASRVKTYDEAKQDASAQLSADLAAAALTKATNEANDKIKAALAEGKSFEDAAKAAGIQSEILIATNTTQQDQADAGKFPASLFNTAKFTAPGALTEPIIEKDRSFIVLVEKREFVTDANTQDEIKANLDRANQQHHLSAFISWIEQMNEAANIERLNRK
jgi:predicted DNA-binding protein (UPF0251 family)